MKKIFFILFCVVILSGCNSAKVQNNNDLNSKAEASSGELPQTEDASKIQAEETTKPVNTENIPESVNLDIPFVSQAPLGSWDNLHNEACEEASIISAIVFLNNESISRDEMDKQILDMVKWQEENFGGHFDLPAEKVKEFVEKYYRGNYKVEISYDIPIEDIKRALASNHPVIVPLSGRTIDNPYFKQPGPVYHMLIIKGYDDNKGEFITNDVGTNKLGENFRYKYENLFDSIHDMPKWEQNKQKLDSNPKMIFNGKKAMLIITK